MKTIECPLAATSISNKDMNDIMRLILLAALPKARIQWHFPRKLVCGTLTSEGFGIYQRSTSQVIEHVHSLIHHSFQESPSDDLHVKNMELVQCHVRTTKPFWDMPITDCGFLVPRGWCPLLGKNCLRSACR